MQLEVVEEEVNVPTRQDEHTEADAAEYLPATQLPVTAESPTVAQYEPAVHAVHADDPEDAKNLPMVQLVHGELPVDEYWPAGPNFRSKGLIFLFSLVFLQTLMICSLY